MRVAWVLEELGEPYEVTVMTREESRAEEHRTRHPLGRVPVLEDNGTMIFESAAICLHLADLNPDSGLIGPLGSSERALVYQWAIFAPAEIEPPLLEAAIYAERDPERAARARVRFDAAALAVSDALEGGEYIAAGRFTVADVLLGSALAFTARAGFADQLPANVQAYLGRLAARPAYQRAAQRAPA